MRIESRIGSRRRATVTGLLLVAVLASWAAGCARTPRVEHATVTYYYLPG